MVGLLVCWSLGRWLWGARNLWQLAFFFFDRSGKVNDDYDDKNLGHYDHIDNDDDDDDADALADLKRWAYHLKMAAKWDLDILVVFLVALRLWGGPLWWRMGDVPPQEGQGVGQIRGN